ncbi:hypothetical protein MMC22_008427 [Lobaria immixta]|nr:hypothetical protein [Lobaria immixta]
MAIDPCVNSNYHKVKPEVDSWIKRVLHADEKWAAKNTKADFAHLVALWAPYCDEEALRMMTDYNNWAFLFDDQFDEGHLSKDPALAQEEIDRTWEILEDTQLPVQIEDNAIRYVFQTTWDRFKKRSSQDLRQRWKNTHREYFDGLLEQVKVMHDQRSFTRSVQEYMDMRSRTIGVNLTIVLIEYAHGIQLPQTVVDQPSIQECMCVCSDLVFLVNDICSYRRELEKGVEHNLIMLLQGQGLSMQKAVDKIGAMINDCYKRWYTGLANVPIWGEKIDREVLRFIDGCRSLALGSLHWSRIKNGPSSKTPATERTIEDAVTDAEIAVDVGHEQTNQATQSAIDAAIKVAVLEERVKWLEVDIVRLSNEVEAWKNLWVSTITEGREGVPLVGR